MTHLIRRRKFGVMSECNDCEWRDDDGKDPMASARRHTTRTGHLTFVTVEYTYKRRPTAESASPKPSQGDTE